MCACTTACLGEQFVVGRMRAKSLPPAAAAVMDMDVGVDNM
jgi:hypothetical protein